MLKDTLFVLLRESETCEPAEAGCYTPAHCLVTGGRITILEYVVRRLYGKVVSCTLSRYSIKPSTI